MYPLQYPGTILCTCCSISLKLKLEWDCSRLYQFWNLYYIQPLWNKIITEKYSIWYKNILIILKQIFCYWSYSEVVVKKLCLGIHVYMASETCSTALNCACTNITCLCIIELGKSILVKVKNFKLLS